GDRPANGRGRDLPEPGLADSLGRRGPHGTARRVDSSSEAVLQPGIDEEAVCAEGIERHAGVARRPRGVDRAQRAGTQFTPLAGTLPEANSGQLGWGVERSLKHFTSQTRAANQSRTGRRWKKKGCYRSR